MAVRAGTASNSSSQSLTHSITDVVNGERNQILLLVENKSDKNVTLQSVAGSFHHSETGTLIKNVRWHRVMLNSELSNICVVRRLHWRMVSPCSRVQNYKYLTLSTLSEFSQILCKCICADEFRSRFKV